MRARTKVRVADALNDDQLYRAFEAARLPADAFGHREHIRAAFVYLSRYADFGVAAARFRRALMRFAARHGVANRYHETLTWAYLTLVRERMDASRARTSVGFVRGHPELVNHRRGALSKYYDVPALTRSRRARRLFVLPKPRTFRRRTS